jgi:hypothetical protein
MDGLVSTDRTRFSHQFEGPNVECEERGTRREADDGPIELAKGPGAGSIARVAVPTGLCLSCGLVLPQIPGKVVRRVMLELPRAHGGVSSTFSLPKTATSDRRPVTALCRRFRDPARTAARYRDACAGRARSMHPESQYTHGQVSDGRPRGAIGVSPSIAGVSRMKPPVNLGPFAPMKSCSTLGCTWSPETLLL